MHRHRIPARYFPLLLLLFMIACQQTVPKPKEKQLVADPESIDAVVQKNIQEQVQYAAEHNGSLSDSSMLKYARLVKQYYEAVEHKPVWSSMEKWKPFANAFFTYLDRSAEDGLFKSDYHFASLVALKKSLDEDSVKRTDAVLWTKADILLTDAFMHVVQDLKQGRLQPDSMSWANDAGKYFSFFSGQLDKLIKNEPLDSVFKKLQPTLNGYWELKKGIRKFLDSMDTRQYTYVPYPYKQNDQKDSAAFVKKLITRLSESGLAEKNQTVDSLQLATIIKKYQQKKKLTADGKLSSSLIKLLNTTDIERFNRIAITLDRYKQMPEKMPEKYILVNLPGFYLQLWDSDTINFTSKVICGKPATSTPFITSAINNIVIFPTWTVPTSIIKKEMLPGLKRNPGYLARKGLKLYNSKGEVVDPYSVNWAKYSKGIPYKIQQGSGEDNALGVIKFNFDNPFDVYLHDTNQRYLFKKSMRALSHGCVRVQEWEKLAFYIIRNDSLQMAEKKDTIRYTTDSITNWIAEKERHRLEIKNRLPLFIRYFGCEGVNGTIVFYDDIYDEDKKAKEKFFAIK
ncbi:MAG: L,D-transpeptidase family protein [Ferruginibacter sp.]